jgi:hypothetical protein
MQRDRKFWPFARYCCTTNLARVSTADEPECRGSIRVGNLKAMLVIGGRRVRTLDGGLILLGTRLVGKLCVFLCCQYDFHPPLGIR